MMTIIFNPSLMKRRILHIIIPQTGFPLPTWSQGFCGGGRSVGVGVSWIFLALQAPSLSGSLLKYFTAPSPTFCQIECKLPTAPWESFSLCKANWVGAAGSFAIPLGGVRRWLVSRDSGCWERLGVTSKSSLPRWGQNQFIPLSHFRWAVLLPFSTASHPARTKCNQNIDLIWQGERAMNNCKLSVLWQTTALISARTKMSQAASAD